MMPSYYDSGFVGEEILAIFAATVIFSLLFQILTVVVSVLAARRIAKDKGLSDGYMWLGLLNWLGLVIIAFIRPLVPPNYYGQYNPYGQQPGQYYPPGNTNTPPPDLKD